MSTNVSLQKIIDRARPRDGQRTVCRNCGHEFNSYGGRLWCRFCRDMVACAHSHSIHGFMVKRDGLRNGRRWCIRCGATFATRRHEGCGAVLFYDLREQCDVPPCERCGTPDGTQLHHWAPSAIFGWAEADRWPTSWLCPSCHSLWHQLMRQAHGVRLPPGQRIDDGETASELRNDSKDAA